MAITIGQILERIYNLGAELSGKALNAGDYEEEVAYADAADMVYELLNEIKEQL